MTSKRRSRSSNQTSKAQSRAGSELGDSAAEHRVEKARLDKARLDASAAEIRTPIDAELSKLAVEEEEATYKEMQADLAGKKAAFASELRIVEIDKELQERHGIATSTIFSPSRCAPH